MKVGKLEKVSLQLFVFMMISNICSYFFQIYIGRLLSVEAYGTVNALIAFSSLAIFPGSVMTATVTKFLAEAVKKSRRKQSLVINSAMKSVAMLQMVTFVVLGLGVPLISHGLNIKDSSIIIFTIVVAILGISSYVGGGILQGLQKFIPYGIQNIILNGSKFIVSVILISMGLNIWGVLMAMAFSYIMSFAYSIYQTRGLIKNYSIHQGVSCVKSWRGYMGRAVLTQSVSLLVLNMDTLLVKLYFSEYMTGIYSSGMIIVKIGMYLATTIVVPLFPMTVEARVNSQKDSVLFYKAFGYGVGGCILYCFGLVQLGKIVIGVVFGERYLEALFLFPYMSLYVVAVTGLLILMNYVLALDNTRFFNVSMMVGISIFLIGTGKVHNKLETMLIFGSIVLIFVLVLNVLWILYQARKELQCYEQ